MSIREGRLDDVEKLARIGSLSRGAATRLLTDRTVRLYTDTETGQSPVAFLSYELTTEAVHVTQLKGATDAYEALLGDVIQYAGTQSLPLEAVVPDRESVTQRALEDAGFEPICPGPRFDATETTRYRFVASSPADGTT